MMELDPSATRVISPLSESIEATEVLPEEYVTSWFPGLERVGKVLSEAPIVTVHSYADQLITSDDFTTVSVYDALEASKVSSSSEEAVIVAVPADTSVTVPFEETVATSAEDEEYETSTP